MRIAELKKTVEYLEQWSKYLIGFKKLLQNKNRQQIYEIVSKSKQPLNIYEISKKTNLTYKGAYKHIKIMHEYGILDGKKNPNSSGQAVTVTIDKNTEERIKALADYQAKLEAKLKK